MGCIPERLFVMVLLCLFTLSFMCQTTSPAAVQHELMIQMGLNSGQYSALFSVSSWASLLDVVNGYIIERYLGLKLATFVYIILFSLGSALYIISGFTEWFWMMATGRLIFGLGGNPAILCMNMYILHWFKGKEVNFMFSTFISVFWLGSSIIYFVSVRLIEYINNFPWITPKMNLAITLCSLTIFFTLIMAISSGTIAILYKKNDETTPKTAEQEVQMDKDKKEKKLLKNMINFRPIFWVFTFSALLYYITIASFMGLSQVFFKEKYQVSIETSSTLSGMFTFLAFLVSPPLGYLIDIIGRNLLIYTIGMLMAFVAHGIMAFSDVSPIGPVIILAVSGSMSSSCWSMYQYLVEEHQFTMAYGVAQTVCQFAIAVGSMGAGYIVDIYGYQALPIFYFFLLVCALPLIALLWVLDRRIGCPLSISNKERKRRVEQSSNMINGKEVSLGNSTPQTKIKSAD